MLKYLNRLPNEYQEAINEDILYKRFDKPIEEYIWKAFQALEILPNIKLLGYEWVPDEEKYDPNDHIVRRNSNKNKAIKNITESRCGVIYIDAEVKGLDKFGNMKVHYIKKPLIVPIQDEKGYYLLKGKKSYMIYQMVDKMLYPSFGSVTIKSLMPICVKILKEEFEDVDGNIHVIPMYNIQIFKSAINILLIYSNYTISRTLNFMEVDRFIKIYERDSGYEKRDDMIYFHCGKRSDIDVAVYKDIFEKEIYVKSIVGCLISLFKETKIKYENIDNWEEWMIIVGGKNTIKRGMYQHIFFNRLLDDTTRDELKINDYDKQNIYYLLRWIVQNYHKLWAKDNLAMEHKRLRCNEMMAALLTQELSDRINRIVSLGDKAGIAEYDKLFRLPSDIFITKLYSSGILRYAESNSDISFTSMDKLTKKGMKFGHLTYGFGVIRTFHSMNCWKELFLISR